jgi:hypothetical protein
VAPVKVAKRHQPLEMIAWHWRADASWLHKYLAQAQNKLLCFP